MTRPRRHQVRPGPGTGTVSSTAGRCDGGESSIHRGHAGHDGSYRRLQDQATGSARVEPTDAEMYRPTAKEMQVRQFLMRVTVALLLLLTMAGCGPDTTASSAGTSSAASWEAPDRYEFTLDSSCGERWLLGRFCVTVNGGDVAEVEALDEQAAGVLSDDRGRESVETLTALLNEAAVARREGADIVEVEMADDGHRAALTLIGMKMPPTTRRATWSPTTRPTTRHRARPWPSTAVRVRR